MNKTIEIELCINMAGTLCDPDEARRELAALRETAERRLGLLRDAYSLIKAMEDDDPWVFQKHGGEDVCLGLALELE